MAEQRHSVRQESYKTVLMTPAGREVLDDLVKFAQQVDISEARALGRADVVLRFEREKKRSYEKPESDP